MEDVLVVGVGGAGCNIAQHVHTLLGGRIVAINTDSKGLENSGITDQLLLLPLRGGGVCTPFQAMHAAEACRNSLSSLMEGSQQLIILAGLGGSAGTGVVPVIAQIALSQGLDVRVAITLPFAFETHRRTLALRCLEDLSAMGLSVLVYDHAAAMEGLDKASGVGLVEMLSNAAQMLGHDVCQQLVRYPSIKA
jgi:cell division GTPase FtsZ